jgi:hypothetical protein
VVTHPRFAEIKLAPVSGVADQPRYWELCPGVNGELKMHEAQPFPPPPDELVGESFPITVPIRYRLEQPVGSSPATAAQQHFERSVADYRQCITANPNT